MRPESCHGALRRRFRDPLPERARSRIARAAQAMAHGPRFEAERNENPFAGCPASRFQISRFQLGHAPELADRPLLRFGATPCQKLSENAGWSASAFQPLDTA